MKPLYTKQGVRDLGNFIKRREVPNQCEHKRLRFCCNYNCGHIICPDCDMEIDSASQLSGKWVW